MGASKDSARTAPTRNPMIEEPPFMMGVYHEFAFHKANSAT